MNLASLATSRNLTIYGVLIIVEALISAAVLLLDGNPATNPDLNSMKMQIMLGIAAIMGKGQSSTGGIVPQTEEAKERIASTKIVAGLLALFLAGPAMAQVVTDVQPPVIDDPTTSVLDGAGFADKVAQGTYEPRWSITFKGLNFAPSASFSPTIVSLKDFSLSVGPNVGAGVDVVSVGGSTRGWGAALHGTLRETANGNRPLASVYLIAPFLAQYKVRPGVSYQIGGGEASYKDSFLVGFAISDNFGFPSK